MQNLREGAGAGTEALASPCAHMDTPAAAGMLEAGRTGTAASESVGATSTGRPQLQS